MSLPEQQSGIAEDDPSIPASEVVFRRLSDGGPSMLTIDTLTGDRRPTTGAFKPDNDGVSVFRQSVLAARGLGPASIVRTSANLVVSVAVDDVRSIALGVVSDAWPEDVDDPGHPRYEAHALLTGLSSAEGVSKSERRRRQEKLVRLPSLTIYEDLEQPAA